LSELDRPGLLAAPPVHLEGHAPGDLVTGMPGWQEWRLGDASRRGLPELCP
jgi:hypothetical protein